MTIGFGAPAKPKLETRSPKLETNKGRLCDSSLDRKALIIANHSRPAWLPSWLTRVRSCRYAARRSIEVNQQDSPGSALPNHARVQPGARRESSHVQAVT